MKGLTIIRRYKRGSFPLSLYLSLPLPHCPSHPQPGEDTARRQPVANKQEGSH